MTADETILARDPSAPTVTATPRCAASPIGARPGFEAIEGCAGIGNHIAVRLLTDGEQVVGVSRELSARARVFTTGRGRKTDATDAHSVALVGTRMSRLRPVVTDEQLEVLRLLGDRGLSPGGEHIRKSCQLHELLLGLIPGGAKRDLSAAQAKALLRPRRRRYWQGPAMQRGGQAPLPGGRELIVDLERIHTRKKAANKESKGRGRHDRNQFVGPARHRTHRCRPVAVRRRGHHKAPVQGALRVLDRHRTSGCLVR